MLEVRIEEGREAPTFTRDLARADSAVHTTNGPDWECVADCTKYTALVQSIDTLGGRPIAVEEGRLYGTIGHFEGSLARRYYTPHDGDHWLVIDVLCHTQAATRLFHSMLRTIEWHRAPTPAY